MSVIYVRFNERLSTLPMDLDVDNLWKQCARGERNTTTDVTGPSLKPQRGHLDGETKSTETSIERPESKRKF